MLNRLREDQLTASSGDSWSSADIIQANQRNRQIPITNESRLNARISERRSNETPLELVAIACMPKLIPTQSQNRLVLVPDLAASSRTSFEIKLKALLEFVKGIERDLRIPINLNVLLADTEALMFAKYSRIPLATATGEILTPQQQEEIAQATLERTKRKVSGTSIPVTRMSQTIPEAFYNNRWRSYLRYFLNTRTPSPTIVDALVKEGMPPEEAKMYSLKAGAASDAQYAIEGAFLASSRETDAIVVIDPSPLFQIAKHEVGSRGEMSYICPLEQ